MPNAQTIEREVLAALAEVGQKQAAATSGISETRLSRWKSSSAEGGGLTLCEVSEILAALGLQVVPAGAGGVVSIPAEHYNALYVLLRQHAATVLGSAT
jgi:hypothetical protein